MSAYYKFTDFVNKIERLATEPPKFSLFDRHMESLREPFDFDDDTVFTHGVIYNNSPRPKWWRHPIKWWKHKPEEQLIGEVDFGEEAPTGVERTITGPELTITFGPLEGESKWRGPADLRYRLEKLDNELQRNLSELREIYGGLEEDDE